MLFSGKVIPVPGIIYIPERVQAPPYSCLMNIWMKTGCVCWRTSVISGSILKYCFPVPGMTSACTSMMRGKFFVN